MWNLDVKKGVCKVSSDVCMDIMSLITQFWQGLTASLTAST